jgi:hypothetical protein
VKEEMENLFSDFILAYAEENHLSIMVLRTRIFNAYMRLEVTTSEVLEFSDMLFEEVIQ